MPRLIKTIASGVAGRTNPYAAPELLESGGQVTQATDSFAFAATLAHVLTGKQPPLDSDGQLDLHELDRQFEESPVTSHRPTLVSQIHNALAAPPESRPQQLSAWMNAITATVSQLAGSPAETVLSSRTAAVAPAAATDSPSKSRRRALPLIIAAAVVLVAAIIFVVTNGKDGNNATLTPPRATVTLTSTVGTTVTTAASATAPKVTESAAATQPAAPAPAVTASNSGGSTNSSTRAAATFSLTTVQPVDCARCDVSADQVNVNGKTYTSTVRLQAGSRSYAEFNVNRNWTTFDADIGFNDLDKSNAAGTFTLYVDGTVAATKALTFGQTDHVTASIQGALRIRLESVATDSTYYLDTLVWMNPTLSR